MAEFVFPNIRAHYVTVNGWHLIFSPGAASASRASKVGFEFAQNCSGLSIKESEEWLRQRYKETHVGVVQSLERMVRAGYFSEPHIECGDCEATLPPLINYGICITHKCNMRCQYCFAAHLRESEVSEDISPSIAHAAIDFLFDTLQPPWANVSLGITGEPQIRWDLVADVMDYARHRSEQKCIGVTFHITTNGLRASPEMLDCLRNHDDVGVTVSWDGPPEIHNRQRVCPDGSGTYERVSDTFEILRRTIKSRPLVTATVSAMNPDMASVFGHLFDKGVRELTLKPARSVGPAIAITEESLPAFKAGYANLAELLLQADHAQIERLFTVAKDDFLGRYIFRIAIGKRFLYRCPGGRWGYDVDTNGDIYPCASLVGVADFKMGNVRTGFDEHMRKFFLEDSCLPNLQACQGCWAKYYCGGTCTYVSAITCGRFDIPYGPDCELTRYLIELAGYIVARLSVERPGLLEHVISLRDIVPMCRRPEASCYRASEGDLWTRPAEQWRVPDPIVLAGKEQAGGCKRRPGSSECSAKIHLRWDDESLYLMAEVFDPIFTPPPTAESEWWLRDSIQFSLDPEKDGGESVYPWKLPEGDYEYGVAWVDGKTYVYDCQIDPMYPSGKGTAIVTRQGEMTTYRVALPWKHISRFIPSVGAECRFSVVINDCDWDVRGWMQWTHGLAIRKAPARFGLLRLVE